MLTKCRAEQQTKIKTCLFYPYPRSYFSEWCHVPINIRQQDHAEKDSMCCVVQCIRCRNQARVKNADLHHPSCTVVMQRRKSVSPVLNVLKIMNLTLSFFSLVFPSFLPSPHLLFTSFVNPPFLFTLSCASNITHMMGLTCMRS